MSTKPFSVRFEVRSGQEVRLTKRSEGWQYALRDGDRWIPGSTIKADTRGPESAGLERAVQEVLWRGRQGLL